MYRSMGGEGGGEGRKVDIIHETCGLSLKNPTDETISQLTISQEESLAVSKALFSF